MGYYKKLDYEIQELQAEIDKLYHNATLAAPKGLDYDNQYLCELLEAEVRGRIEVSFEESVEDLFPKVRNFRWLGGLYQYGRGGRTVCFEGLIERRGGPRFSFKSARELAKDMEPEEVSELRQVIRDLNDAVKSFCASVYQESLEYIQEEYQDEIKKNKGKKKVKKTIITWE